MNGEQVIVAPLFHLDRDVVFQQLRALRSGTLAVLEDKTVFEAALFHQLYRLLEVLVRLAAKANNKIARHGITRDGFTNPLHHVAVILDRVAALHALQHDIRTALQWNVQVRRNLRQIADRLQQLVAHILGIVRHELQALDAVNLLQLVQQIGEPRRRAALDVLVAVYGLAEQRDLFAALICQDAGFVINLLGRSALFRSARRRDDAVGAELVATDLDAQIRLKRSRAHRRVTQRIERLVAPFDLIERAVAAAQSDCHLAFRSGLDPLDQFRNLLQLAGAYDQVHVRSTFEDQLLIFLSHAPDHADDFFRMLCLEFLQMAERAVRLLFGVFPDAACIEQQRVGLLRVRRQLVAVLTQTRHDHLAVEDVHLAADGFDVQTFGHGSFGEGESAGRAQAAPRR